jgi:hypothetical protein
MRLSIISVFLLIIGLNANAQSTQALPKEQSLGLENNEVNNASVVISRNFEDPNCYLEENNEIVVNNTVVKGNTAACVELKATDYIDIVGFFDSELGSTFDASIVGNSTPVTPPPVDPPVVDPPVVVPPVVVPPVVVPPVVTPEIKECENLANHGPANPHLYSHSHNSQLVGNLVAKYTPEYKIEGKTDWKLMQPTGPMIPGSPFNLYYYAEGSDATERVTILRTKEGCPEYRDIRSQSAQYDMLEPWVTLRSNLPAINPVPNEFLFWVNSEMGGKKLNDIIKVYEVVADKVYPGMHARFMTKNSEDRILAFNEYQPFYDHRVVNRKMHTADFDVDKDFIMDVSVDYFQTVSRYNIHRYQQGGHWSVVTTLTRHDGKVSTSVQGIDYDVDQILVNNATGQSYYCNVEFGNTFDLGFLPDGVHQFSLKTYHGVTINNRILVSVKRPSLN